MRFTTSSKLLNTVFLLTLAGTAGAEIVGFDPANAKLVRNPADQKYFVDAYDKHFVFVWNERRGVTLPNDLAIDILGPGLGGPEGGVYYAKEDLGTYAIPAGMRVDSEYIVYNPARPHITETTIRFSGTILGVLLESDWPKVDRLFTTDGFALYDVPRRNFPSYHYDARGADFPDHRSQAHGADANWIRVNSHEVTVHFFGAHPGDHVRIITTSDDLPVAPILHNMPVGGTLPPRYNPPVSRPAPTPHAPASRAPATRPEAVPQTVPHIWRPVTRPAATPSRTPIGRPVARPGRHP